MFELDNKVIDSDGLAKWKGKNLERNESTFILDNFIGISGSFS